MLSFPCVTCDAAGGEHQDKYNQNGEAHRRQQNYEVRWIKNFEYTFFEAVISTNQIKAIRSLQQKKFRKEYGRFVVEGRKGVELALASDWKIIQVLGTSGWFNSNMHLIQDKSIHCHEVSEKELRRMSSLKTPDEVMAVVTIPEASSPSFDSSILVLDGVSDPGNLGTIIRTALWFGIRQIAISKGSVDPFSPKVVMSTMGALFGVQLFQTDLKSMLNTAGMPVVGFALEGEEQYSGLSNDPLIMMFGSESHGIGKELRDQCDHLIRIPGADGMESLNLGVSVGIGLHQWFSHRNG